MGSLHVCGLSCILATHLYIYHYCCISRARCFVDTYSLALSAGAAACTRRRNRPSRASLRNQRNSRALFSFSRSHRASFPARHLFFPLSHRTCSNFARPPRRSLSLYEPRELRAMYLLYTGALRRERERERDEYVGLEREKEREGDWDRGDERVSKETIKVYRGGWSARAAAVAARQRYGNAVHIHGQRQREITRARRGGDQKWEMVCFKYFRTDLPGLSAWAALSAPVYGYKWITVIAAALRERGRDCGPRQNTFLSLLACTVFNRFIWFICARWHIVTACDYPEYNIMKYADG